MPLAGYGVLKGRLLDRRREGGHDSPHYQIHVEGGGSFRVAVNVLSAQPPSELLYIAVEEFHHPILDRLVDLPDGFTPLKSRPGGLALDFVRGNLFDRTGLHALPPDRPGPDNDLADRLDHHVQRATADPTSHIYAFGQRWGPEPTKPDKIFGFVPGNGVHDVHMNQGNSGRFIADDGSWQDGALLFHFPTAGRWTALFLAFQSQAWHTDDTTGHTLRAVPSAGPGGQPAPGEPDRRLRIVAALVNPIGPAPEAESVTLLNTTPGPVDLTGWTIIDSGRHRFPLPPTNLPAGDTVRIPLAPPVGLGNRGGIITLLDQDGLKVDGVAYTATDASREGHTIIF
ncbi:hypothetical protein ThrDRAFT_03511 [Frankia casuarinae]|uniref:LTD domain-containing protein n=2 Tax=Frankia casuarinae (strain DSM 45818 / CECT 9043 / HFP020203 / CcI3) TaxID=106370 RepID=Q2J7Y8_FRACC|nr:MULTISPECIES: DUF2278 family protein [Frankia]ABD12604.1 conserved hypothetical protein [Frankia casuarinae]ETA00007.1 hypothetical protein CcI6DRAFT_04580 [Frankia sp. CcI6]EYT90863.1 hypothetical protein ThrDRAFT_03511 [Frankia casuarinae]KDA41851.1 hypothetical protein BMG523Draft_03322 [Frankia sp. BMG5.23]KFB02752.1 hypothetical protein ALLO2DRAFT_04502 [Frankia sp. Allo2]